MNRKSSKSPETYLCAVIAPKGSSGSLDELLQALAALDNLCIVVFGDTSDVGIPVDWTLDELPKPFDPKSRTIFATTAAPGPVLDAFIARCRERLAVLRLGDKPTEIDTLSLMDAGAIVMTQGDVRNCAADDDLVGPPAVLAESVANICRPTDERAQRAAALSKQEIREVCEVLRSATGHDFKHYKDSTLSRRILRRLHVSHCPSFDDYLDLLKGDSDAARALMRDLLIGVTAFFRDRDAFGAVDRKVIEKLIGPGGPRVVRIWVAGCSTGQEAYSLAMLVQDRMTACDSDQEVQIFATDLDERALSVARRGFYPAAAVEQLDAERLGRFFTKTGTRYQVNKELRQRIVFSPHNLIADPPFSRMDMIACRNVMIYLGPHLQKKLISLFHYALRENGYLFLGSSEAVTGHGDLFRVIDGRARIAQRKETGARNPMTRAPVAGATIPWQNFAGATSENVAAISQRIILDEFAPPYLIVTDDGQITYASAGTDPFIQIPEGQYVNNMMRIVRTGIRTGLRSAWAEALKTRRKTVHEGLSVDAQDQRRRIRIIVQPMPDLGEDAGTYMVVFHDLGTVIGGEASTPNTPDNERLFAELEAELFQAREELEHSVQDLEAANEELKSSNEELLSMNEELQSANEELESSKDEVDQANSALEGINTDLVNLLSATRIATIFLDSAGNLRRFTPVASDFYNITEADIGRPLSHFTHRFIDLAPFPTAAELLAADDAVETEAVLDDGSIYMRRVTPYLTGDGVNSGTVVTFIDITEAKLVQDALELSQRQLGHIAAHAPVMLVQLSADERYTFVNDSYAALFGKTGKDLIGASVRDVLGEQSYASASPHLQRCFAGAFVEYDLDTIDGQGTPRNLRVNYAPERDATGKVSGILAAVVDITERTQAQQALQASEARFAAYQQASPDGFMVFESERGRSGEIRDFIISYANEASSAITGRSVEHMQGATLLSLFPGNRDAGLFDEYVKVVQTGQPFRREFGYDHDGINTWFGVTAVKVADGFAVMFADISERKAQEAQVAQSAGRLQRVLDSVVAFVGVLDIDGSLLEANQPALDAAGVARGDVIGQPFWDAPWWSYDPAVQDRLKDAIARANNGETVRYDAKIQLRDDQYIFIDFQIVPIVDAGGNIVELIPSGVDINDRLLAEEAVRESATRLSETLDGVATLVGLLDTDGMVADINATAMSMVTASKSDVIGKYFPETPWWDISQDVRDRVGDAIRRAATGETVRQDLPWIGPDGSELWVDFSVTPVTDAEGRVTALVPSGADITDRRAAQHALEESRERLRLATHAALLGTFDFNVGTGTVSWDARAREILGLSPAQTSLEDFLGMVHKDDCDTVFETTGQGLDPAHRERMKATEYRFLRPDGAEIWVEGHASLASEPQGRVVGTIQDVTSRKHAQQHQELLLGELNHRVKNSLAVIQAMATHTLRNADNLDAFRTAFTGRLGAIASAHDILIGNEHSGANLAQLLRSQIGAYADLERQVVLDGPHVTISPTVSHALGLVLHELTTNASKYGALTSDAGTLTIRWEIVKEHEPNHVRLFWEERGGPSVTPPERHGFGSRLIETSLTHSLNGSVEMAYDPKGFSATLSIPVEAEDDK